MLISEAYTVQYFELFVLVPLFTQVNFERSSKQPLPVTVQVEGNERKGWGPRWAPTATNPCPRKSVISTKSHGSRTRSCSNDLQELELHSMPLHYWFIGQSKDSEGSRAQTYSIDMQDEVIFASAYHPLIRGKMAFCIIKADKKPMKLLFFYFLLGLLISFLAMHFEQKTQNVRIVF